jgi:hypothetical protein
MVGDIATEIRAATDARAVLRAVLVSGGAVAVFFAVIGILFSAIAGLVVFCASFTILNPLLQVQQLALRRIPTLIEQELSNGVFGLRIASLFICYRTLAYMAQIVLVEELRYFDERFFDRASNKYPELDGFDEKVGNVDQDYIYLSQWGLYAMVLANLWVLTILPQESTLVAVLIAVLSFGLFFIFDDWTVTTEYARNLKGRILPWHDFRVHFFNVVLIGPLLALIFLEFSWAGAIISTIIICIFLFWRYAAVRFG